ncbi:MAG: hypothetical protein V8S74_08095 [Lachnospirales bacterium]
MTDEKLIEQASLRQVSLFDLAQHYGLPDPDGFARRTSRLMNRKGGKTLMNDAVLGYTPGKTFVHRLSATTKLCS